jgi:hypothetical protein
VKLLQIMGSSDHLHFAVHSADGISVDATIQASLHSSIIPMYLSQRRLNHHIDRILMRPHAINLEARRLKQLAELRFRALLTSQ